METNQIVISPSIARKLLKLGFEICDICPQRTKDGTIDFTRCVFLFKGKDGLSSTIESLIR